MKDSVANGADDNASGTIALLKWLNILVQTNQTLHIPTRRNSR
jgi:Zn-dependent M28 family amino/carboxypeptidase